MGWFNFKNNYSTCIKCKGDFRPNDKYIQCDTGYYVHEGCDYRTCQYCKGTIENREKDVFNPTGCANIHHKCRFGDCGVCGKFISENGVVQLYAPRIYRHRMCKSLGPPDCCML